MAFSRGSKLKNPKRIVFHEITKKAILEALENPGRINMNMVNAQLARQALDFVIGIGGVGNNKEKYPGLCNLLWNNIKGPRGMSAGRVQSVVVKLVYDLGKKIEETKTSNYYKVEGRFALNKPLQANINKNYDEKQGIDILKLSLESVFVISNIVNKEGERKPPPPYITSSLQQDANKIGLSTKMIMNIAQKLYENGFITYHRTDSFNLSNDFIRDTQTYVVKIYGKEYSKPKNFKSKGGAQEAHEAIRPTSSERLEVNKEWNSVYQLIWKRAMASQMSNQIINTINVSINSDKYTDTYHSIVEEELFPGFKILYGGEKNNKIMIDFYKSLKKGTKLKYKKIIAIQTSSTKPDNYTESTLVKILEKKGIGRPSTYASVIEKIQDKGYVVKTNLVGKTIDRTNYYVDDKSSEIHKEIKKHKEADKKNRLVCSDLGIEVTEFLYSHFKSNVMNYEYTAEMEDGLDFVSKGNIEKNSFLTNSYKDFNTIYSKLNMSKQSNDFDKGRLIGKHPQSGEPIYVRVAKYGPVAQVGEYAKGKKLKYINIDKDKKLEDVTLEYVLSKEPRVVGRYHDKDIVLLESKFGYCLKCDDTFYSLTDEEKGNLDKIDEKVAISIIRKNKPRKFLGGKAIVKMSKKDKLYLLYNDDFITFLEPDEANEEFISTVIKKLKIK